MGNSWKNNSFSDDCSFDFGINYNWGVFFIKMKNIKEKVLKEAKEDGEDTEITLIFYSESWHEIKDGKVLKPSQGWRYYPK